MEDSKIKEFRENNLEKSFFLNDEICAKVIDGSFVAPTIEKELSSSGQLIKTIAGKRLDVGDFVLITKPNKNLYSWSPYLNQFNGKIDRVSSSMYGNITLDNIPGYNFKRSWLSYIDQEASTIPEEMIIKPLDPIRIGDYVKIVKPEITTYNNQGWRSELDSISGTIKKIINISGIQYLVYGTSIWLKREWLELQKDIENKTDKIKIGDAVTVIGPQRNDEPGWIDYSMRRFVGRETVVTAISGYCIYTNLGGFYLLEGWLRLSKNDKVKTKQMDVGDIVVVVEPQKGYDFGWVRPDMDKIVGKRAIITKKGRGCLYIDIMPEFFFLEEWLKLDLPSVNSVDPNVSISSKKKKSVENKEFVVGSKVRIVGAKFKSQSGWIYPMPGYVGKEAVVEKIEKNIKYGGYDGPFFFLSVLPTYYFLGEWLELVDDKRNKNVEEKDNKLFNFKVGDTVIIKKPVEPTVKWTPNMDRYNNLVGKVVSYNLLNKVTNKKTNKVISERDSIFIDTASVEFDVKFVTKVVPESLGKTATKAVKKKTTKSKLKKLPSITK